MEIEIGEYVRTRGIIGKVEEVTSIGCWIENDKRISKRDVEKHSKNIIDLIEVGDIVELNGDKYEVIYDKSYEKLGILITDRNKIAIRHCAIEYIFSTNGVEEFKKITILTHEVFENNCYKVVE